MRGKYPDEAEKIENPAVLNRVIHALIIPDAKIFRRRNSDAEPYGCLEMKNKIDVMKIDVEGLTLALEDAESTTMYYLDLETGKVIRISELFPAPEDEKLMEKIREGVGRRYLEAPRMSSQESYEDMVDFIKAVEDENLKEKLYIAIDGPGAFRRFKNVLLRCPVERKRWFKFKESRLRERTAEWPMAEGMMEKCEIEIREVSREDILNLGVDEEWKEVGRAACLK
jgi:hypothetical protein